MLQLTLTGTSTLLMHNVQLGDPDNEYVREIAKLNALKGKITDEQRAERDRLKWRGGLYWEDGVGPIMPAANVFRSIQQSASVISRSGKDVERGIIIADPAVPLDYDGPRDLAGLWNNGTGRFIDRRMAKINRAPIVAVRPAFPDWSCTFRLELDEDVMSRDDFEYAAVKAGKMIHIGDYRRFFGAYSVEIEDI